MTPEPLRERLLDRCDLRPGMRVLDPGVGTGEFLASVRRREPLAEIYGWDVDPEVLSVAGGMVPEARLSERSALDPYHGEQFDLVVGNPPYFQFKAPGAVRSHFSQVISGRVNIFALFFQAGFEVLRSGGQLAYVVPPSMNNGAYFERLRGFLARNASIEFLKIYRDQSLFDGARTPVQLIVLRLGERDSGRHVFVRESPSNGFRRTIFSERPSELERAFSGRRTMYELGYEAVTGTIVWNQHKADLRHEAGSNSYPLIWAHNIRETLSLDSARLRPQFIETQRIPLVGPAIVTNRIVGSVGSAEFRCALVPEGMSFLGENHVNVIKPRGIIKPEISMPQLLDILKSPLTVDRIRRLTGNTQISATELTHLLPLVAQEV